MRPVRYIAILLLLTLVGLAVLGPGVAAACPTCKEAVGNEQSNLVNGYFWSIVFMMSMPFLIFTGMSLYFYILVRRARAARTESPVVAISAGE